MTEPLVGVYLALLVGLVGAAAVAVWRGNAPALTNALVSIAVAVAPTLVPVVAGNATVPVLDVAPVLSVWLAVAGLVHTIGMFGPYDTVWWWDHLTHTLSATLLAALVYATLLAADPDVAGASLDRVGIGAGTVLFTLALGVVWEFLELGSREFGRERGVEPVLEYYGLRDTVLDLAFNAVGAAIVVALDLRVFLPIATEASDLAAAALGGTVVVGFLVTVAIVAWLERRH